MQPKARLLRQSAPSRPLGACQLSDNRAIRASDSEARLRFNLAPGRGRREEGRGGGGARGARGSSRSSARSAPFFSRLAKDGGGALQGFRASGLDQAVGLPAFYHGPKMTLWHRSGLCAPGSPTEKCRRGRFAEARGSRRKVLRLSAASLPVGAPQASSAFAGRLRRSSR
jgi:hypothetical protein